GAGLVGRVVVDDAGDELLAGPALALDEHGGARGRDLAHLLDDRLHLRALGDDVAVQARGGGVHREDGGAAGLAAQVEGPAQDQLHLVRREGLGQIVESPVLHRPDGRSQVGVGRHDDDRRLSGERLQLGDEVDAVGIGKAHVAENEDGIEVREDATRLRGGAGGLHVEGRAILALREQLGLEEVAETRIVLDDEEAFFHPSNPSDSSSSRSRRMVSSSWWAMRRHACPALLWISRLCRRECKAKPTLVAAWRRSWTMALCPGSVGRSSLASSIWPRARMPP